MTEEKEELKKGRKKERRKERKTENGDKAKGLRSLLRLKRLWLLLTLPAAVILLILADKSQYFAEVIFARHIFKWISQGISAVTGLVPFSIVEWLIIAAPFAVILAVIVWIAGMARHRQEWRLRLVKGFLNVLCTGCLVFFVYAVGCGVNYYRYPFSYFCGLEVQPSSAEELYGLCWELASEANALREGLPEDEEGVYRMSFSIRELGNEVIAAYRNIEEDYPVLGGRYPAPKPVFFSRAMSRTELTGIYIPLTMEANVNVDVPDYSIASTMCHEEAHLRGFIKEDEANYIAWLVCRASDNQEVRYSGVVEALIIAGNALYRKNQDLYYQARAVYSDGLNADLRANSLYWEQFEDTVISNTADKLNDAYLKANNQSDGVQSYGRMVDLLLAEYRKRHETE